MYCYWISGKEIEIGDWGLELRDWDWRLVIVDLD